MDIIEAFATKNKCYHVATPLTPQGIMLHSIGTPQLSNVLANNIFTVAVRWERE